MPFVDVLNTMLDDTLPLTPGEWPEWGNPITDKAAFDHIRSYSPYDNVKAQDYPPMLITGGLTDPRVTYWEPAKWAAKLRATKTDGNLLLLKINMGAGHGGKSGRWDKLHEVAETYGFILTQTGGMSRPIFEMTLTAAPEHIDELGHVNNAVWVQWIQQVAVAHWDSFADPAHKDAYYWVVVRHEIDYLRAAHRGRPHHRADLGRRCAAGRAVRPVHRVHRRRRQSLRSIADPVGDYRQGAGPADPRASGSDSAVRCARVSTAGHEPNRPLRLLSVRPPPIGCGSRSTSRAWTMSSRPVNLLEAEQKSDEYRALNPQGLVPMLEIDGHRLTQSLAIINYLDLRFPNQPLIPAAAAERAHVVAMAMTVACDIHPLNNLRVLKYLKNELGHSQEEVDRWYAHWIREGLPRSKRWPRRRRASSCSATRRPARTCAWSRSSTMRGGSTCRSTISRPCSAPRRMRTRSRRSPPRIRTGKRSLHEGGAA